MSKIFVVARASSPASSGGVPPRESARTVSPRSGTLPEPAAGTAALRGTVTPPACLGRWA